MKKRILVSLGACGIFFGSAALSLGVAFFGFAVSWWLFFSALFLAGSLAAFYFAFAEEKSPPPPSPKFPEFEKFMKECKLTFRGHLKLSILFWILAYRKEKAKSFEDAKREVFLEVKKEIPHVRWMDAILDEVQESLSKVKQ